MGLFSRRPKDTPQRETAPVPSQRPELVGPELGDDGRPVSAALTPAERERISRALTALAERGVDVDDLAALGAAYDAALAGAEDPASAVELFGVAVGEHLARHSARSWAVVTDVFGTDLGLVAARGDTVVVPHNLVSSRWMRGETGWLPGVVAHLVRLAPRSDRR